MALEIGFLFQLPLRIVHVKLLLNFIMGEQWMTHCHHPLSQFEGAQRIWKNVIRLWIQKKADAIRDSRR
jgi:hypothetical protein